MNTIQSLEDLNHFRETALEARHNRAGVGHVQVNVSLGSCGIAVGALDTLKALQQQVAESRLSDVIVGQTGCTGLCSAEPIVEVITRGLTKVTYGRVTPDMARRIVQEHVIGGHVVEEYVVKG